MWEWVKLERFYSLVFLAMLFNKLNSSLLALMSGKRLFKYILEDKLSNHLKLNFSIDRVQEIAHGK